MADSSTQTTRHAFNRTILREYDIRGVVGETLFPADAWAIGRSFGSIVLDGGGVSVALGYDGRLSSPELQEALVEGLLSTGVDVVHIGLGPTPMLYYATVTQGVDAGIMVTGSHNPPTHNGFKMMMGKKSFYGADIQRLGQVSADGAWRNGAGKLTDISVFDAYVARVAKDFDGARPLKAVWDAGNGATGETLVALVKQLPGEHILLNEAIDGTFPAHHPDPTEPHNLIQLQDKVRETGADIGIAFDGDGDRIGIVDGQGRILWGDQILVILGRDVLRTHPGSTIIADVKASQVLFDQIAEMGGKPLMWKTGHSLIKSKMAEVQSPLAGEMSGHIFFADRWYGFDDAQYAAVRMLGILGRSELSIDAMRDAMPAVINTPELRFPCVEERKFAIIDEVKARLAATGATVSDVDGVRVTTPDGWWLLRASNTQAVLVARAEASSEAGLGRLKAILSEQLSASGLTLPAF